jgi:hypothetical protein
MPHVGFELTIPVFERTKTVHALDRAATVIPVFIIVMWNANDERILNLYLLLCRWKKVKILHTHNVTLKYNISERIFGVSAGIEQGTSRIQLDVAATPILQIQSHEVVFNAIITVMQAYSKHKCILYYFTVSTRSFSKHSSMSFYKTLNLPLQFHN